MYEEDICSSTDYNRQLTIERCINSILNQTIPVEEIVIVDDGSNDNTLKIIKAINCNKIKVIKQNHRERRLQEI